MRLDRRIPFFAIVSVVCALLVWPCAPSLRYVPITMSIVYAVFTVLFLLDWLSRRAELDADVTVRR